MKNSWKWIFGAVITLALLITLPLIFRTYFGYGGMMGGYDGWRHPMMGGYGSFPFGGWLMGLGMLLAWTIPLGILFLVIYGAVRLANRPDMPVPAKTCPNCSKAVQADWKNCPYCRTGL
ncbi:MAG: zinc ribbon domain-containing protein [Anaerolineales bacterium]|nr:zinc ribbon domain-containing protein [Anaerolineales bacterium]